MRFILSFFIGFLITLFWILFWAWLVSPDNMNQGFFNF